MRIFGITLVCLPWLVVAPRRILLTGLLPGIQARVVPCLHGYIQSPRQIVSTGLLLELKRALFRAGPTFPCCPRTACHAAQLGSQNSMPLRHLCHVHRPKPGLWLSLAVVVTRLLRVLRVPRLLRSGQAKHALWHLQLARGWSRLTSFHLRIMRLVFGATLYLHWMCCLCFLVPAALHFPRYNACLREAGVLGIRMMCC
jgi:hypothetical protein